MLSRFLTSIAICLLASIASFPADCLADRPNVILIMTDDQGYGDFGFTGNLEIETPNLDALSQESMWFDKFYVCPVCSPTRACMMTGRYNYRTRVVDTYVGRSMMDPSEVTIAELMSAAGYRTGIFGKWHLGDCYPMRPQDQGFQVSLIHRGGGIGQNSDPIDAESKYTDPILQLNGMEREFNGYCTDIYYENAEKFIADSVRDNRPFFVYLPDNCPHGPFGDVPKKWLDYYHARREKESSDTPDSKRNDKRDRIFAMISNIDQNIGRLLRHLESLDVAENTIVIFLTDNGPNGQRYVAGMKGMKASVHEGGIRTPLLFRWPAQMKRVAKVNSRHAHIDILPTILDACEIELPDNLDGRSFLAAIDEPEHNFGQRTIFIQSHRGNRPQRYHHFAAIDNRWKLLHHSGFGKQSFSGAPKFELYDLESDPLEKNNLAEKNEAKVAELKYRYDCWFDDVGSERSPNYEPPRIVIGLDSPVETVLTRQDLRPQETDRPFSANSAWWMSVKEDGKYDVDFVFKGKLLANEAKLLIGNRTITAPFDDQSNSAEFKAVTIKAGPMLLRGFIEKPTGERILVHQVTLSRRK